MSKQLIYNKAARLALLSGIKTLAYSVGATLGPLGNNVAIDKSWGAPNVIHDGVTVAKEIELEDPFENMGAQLVKEAASKTNDVAGDGTTTATILAYGMIKRGFDLIEGGANPMRLRKGMKEASEKLVAEIKKLSKPVIDDKEVEQIAQISAQDEQIGALIAKAVKQTGKDGVITIEEGNSTDITLDFREGMEFDKGYASAYFVTDREKMIAEIENPYILITDRKIVSLDEIVETLNKLVRSIKSLVIIADEIEGEALATLVVNNLRGNMKILAIKAPGFGDRRKAMLEDIAILTGGKMISGDLGEKLENIEISDLGRADKVKSDQDKTIVVNGKGTNLNERIEQIRSQISATTSDFDREKLQERLAKLINGVAVINIGAFTELEMREKKERVIDAVAATKAALEEGILPGGATTYPSLKIDTKLTGEEKQGFDLVVDSLNEPLRTLLENAGIQQMPESKFGWGIDVTDGIYKNMIEAGIIDPTKVSRSAIENSVSVASTVLTTMVLIANVKKEDNNGE